MHRKVPGRVQRSLFSKLISYFIVVLAIPLGLFAAYYTVTGERNQTRFLMEETAKAIQDDAQSLSSTIEEYRHKAYMISTDPLVVSILREDALQPDSRESRQLYQRLFDVMKGDTYLASANLVSDSGNVRVSTHRFPDVYDIRYQGNDWDLSNVIAQNRDSSLTASTISIGSPRITENGKQVVASIFRRVYDADGTVYGYLVVDLFLDALLGSFGEHQLLGDELLIDTESFHASSLAHPERHGTFYQFPYLAALEGNFSRSVTRMDDTIVSVQQIGTTALSLAGVVSAVPFEQNMNRWLAAFGLMMCIGIAIATTLAFFFSRTISRPIGELALAMKSVEEGSLETKETHTTIDEFTRLDNSFNAMVTQISNLLEITREEETKLAEAERKALESQMNPHFLFNTLNTIKALAKIHGEEQIYTITIKLGKLLRSAIDNHESECTLEESMALAESYLTIQQIRYGEKLSVTTSIDDRCRKTKTPKLIIQPLVENSVVHGLEPKAGQWHVEVKIGLDGDFVTILITDDGVGFPPPGVPKDLDELANSSHVGVYNVYRRLVLRYGDKMTFAITSEQDRGTAVSIRFPFSA
jgi:two-component system sensor histidine kinase YesM